MSATLDSYQKKLFRQVFGVREETILRFPNYATITDGNHHNNFDMRSVVKSSELDLVDCILA